MNDEIAAERRIRQHAESIGLCGSCGARVIWCKNEKTGKPAPIDAECTLNGNILVLPGNLYAVLPKREVAEMLSSPAADGGGLSPKPVLHTNHFMTCPQAKTWRQSGYHTARKE